MRINDPIQELFKKEGVTLSDELQESFKTANPLHPLPYVLMNIEMEIMKINGLLYNPDLTTEGTLEVLLDLQKIPDPLFKTFSPIKDQMKIVAPLWLEAYHD